MMWLDILGGSLEYSWLKRTKDVEMRFWPYRPRKFYGLIRVRGKAIFGHRWDL